MTDYGHTTDLDFTSLEPGQTADVNGLAFLIYNYPILLDGEPDDNEIEIEAPDTLTVTASGHHYVTTRNGFDFIMPPGWAFIDPCFTL